MMDQVRRQHTGFCPHAERLAVAREGDGTVEVRPEHAAVRGAVPFERLGAPITL